MPWQSADALTYKKGLDAKGQRQWAHIANAALKRCMDNGGSEASCAAGAIRQANGAVGTNAVYSHYETGSEAYSIRYETLRGRRHMVVPVVLMVEGVHAGSHGPLLHRQDDLGRFPGSWNGIPITVMHPTDGEGNVSANSPGMIDGQAVGAVFNTSMQSGKLKAEAWLDELALQNISPQAMAHIMERRPLDVSVGVFTEDLDTPGEWNGERYDGVATGHRPDHLALLPGGRGACSWTDGCGIRANALVTNQVGRLRYEGTEADAWTPPSLSDFGIQGAWKDLTDQQRADIAGHFLVGTSAAKSFGDLKLPVVNPKTKKLNKDALQAVLNGRAMEIQGVGTKDKQAAQRMAHGLLGSEFGDQTSTGGGDDVKNHYGTNTNAVKYDGTESTAWKKPALADFGVQGQWGDLSAADKSKVTGHFLVGTAGAETFDDLKLPVVNPKTGKLNEKALRAVISGRGSQANIPAEQLVAARKQAYKLLNDEFEANLEVPSTLSFVEALADQWAKDLQDNELSFDDIDSKLRRIIDMMDNAMKVHYMADVFPDHFIYKVKVRDGMAGMLPGMGEEGCLMFKQGYKMDGENVELVGDPVPVTRQVQYVTMEGGRMNHPETNAAGAAGAAPEVKFPTPKQGEVHRTFMTRCMGDAAVKALPGNGGMKKCGEQWSAGQGGQNNMATNQPCCPEKVEMLIQDERSKWGEGDREFLLTMTAGQLAKLEITEQPQINQEQAVHVLSDTLGNQEKLMAILPPQTRGAIAHGLKLYEAERVRKVQHILANTVEGVYTKEALDKMADGDLENLARAVKAPVDYSGMLPAESVQTHSAAGEILLPPGVQAQ